MAPSLQSTPDYFGSMRVVPSGSKQSVIHPPKNTVGVPVRGTENMGFRFKNKKGKWFKELARKVLVNLSLRYLGIHRVKLVSFCSEMCIDN